VVEESPSVVSVRRTLSGFLFVILAAALGLALVWLPSFIVTQYSRITTLGGVWGVVYLAVVGAGMLLFLSSLGWLVWRLWGASLAKRRRRERRNRNPSRMTRDQMEREIDENLAAVGQLDSRSEGAAALETELKPLARAIQSKRVQQTLEIVAFGTISSGKSSVLNLLAGRDVFATEVKGGTTVRRSEIPWPSMDKVILVDTPGLGEVDGAPHVAIAADAARDADLILLIVDGPLRASEFQLLETLGAMEKRILIVLNKVDWYGADDRDRLIGQLARQTAAFVEPDDIVFIQAQESFRMRRVVAPDGREYEETVAVEPNIDPLARRMLTVLERQGKNLLAANLLLQSRGLVEKAKQRVRQSLDDRAWRIVDSYMWGAGGLAAISPWPVIDLAAGCAVSTKMIIDLADVYQQKIDLETASQWLAQMGKNLIGVVGAHGATVAVTAIVASLIKTVPIAGTITGGILQGAVQALITKWIGAVFIAYFRDEMQEPEGGLAGLARRQWQQVTSLDELSKLVGMARERLAARGTR